MRLISGLPILAALFVSVAVARPDEPKDCVRFAPSWEAAVEEAKLLNLPIVVHNHGFYCPPCWGMHRAVLQNDKYIRFAEENSVEVIALQDLRRGIEKGDRNAATYKAKDADGNMVEYLIEWPGLTAEQLESLHSSPASGFNRSGGVPYTAVVDPYTLSEMASLKGGSSAKSVMELVAAQRKVLEKQHGPGYGRKALRQLEEQERVVGKALESEDAPKAMGALAELERKNGNAPEGVRRRIGSLRERVLKSAGEQLDAIERAGPASSVPALERLARALSGTEPGTRASELLAKAKAKPA